MVEVGGTVDASKVWALVLAGSAGLLVGQNGSIPAGRHQSASVSSVVLQLVSMFKRRLIPST